MMTAQWAKGNGGTYLYYRCTRKNGACDEPYVQEHSVVSQCLDFLKPLAISSEEATFLADLIDQDAALSGKAVESAASDVGERLIAIQAKLNKLTSAFLDEVIDEESYQAAKSDLILEKTVLKKKKEHFQKTCSGLWIEPAKEVIKALESAGKQQAEKSPEVISELVQKIGTNRLMSRKKVTAGFAQPYLVTSQILASVRREFDDNELPHGDRSKTCLNTAS